MSRIDRCERGVSEAGARCIIRCVWGGDLVSRINRCERGVLEAGSRCIIRCVRGEDQRKGLSCMGMCKRGVSD